MRFLTMSAREKEGFESLKNKIFFFYKNPTSIAIPATFFVN